MSELRYETFHVDGAAGTLAERGAGFVRQTDLGFLDAVRSEELVIRQLDRYRGDQTLLTGVYDDDQLPGGLPTSEPVATFGEFPGTIGVGGGKLVDGWMITDVTVRGTHRRRGILKTIMTAALARGKERGVPVAALTASEGAIYGRFGFAPAAFTVQVTIRTDGGLQLRADVAEAVRAAGLRLQFPTWEQFATDWNDIVQQFQLRTPGQIRPTHAFRQRATGARNAWAETDNTLTYRPLVMRSADGRALAYALTRAEHTEGYTTRMEVAEFAGVDQLAEVALWDALAATDLVAELRWNYAPIDFALPFALADARAVSFTRRSDALWLRILDVPAAFRARGLQAEGSLRLRVSDGAGLASGEWTITQWGNETTVTDGVDDDSLPLLELDAETLGTLYLGSARVRDIVALSRARTTDVDAVAALLDAHTAPRNTFGF